MGLSSSYDQVIVGKSYPSLVYAIAQKVIHGKKNLVVDDSRFQIGDKWVHNIGRLELKALSYLGEKLNVSCLKHIEKYAKQANTMIFLNDRMVELGSSPYANIKELARKLPECFSEDFISNLGRIDPEKFDQEAENFFNQVLSASLGGNVSEKALFNVSSEVLAPVFDKFVSKLNSEKLITKQLHYILQAFCQTIISNSLSEVEARYLLTQALSPRYTVEAAALEDELAFSYKGLGGDIKKTRVQEFQIYQKKLEYILLESYEGLVKTERTLLFGHFGESLPFECSPGSSVYHSIKVQAPLEEEFARPFCSKRIIFSPDDRMGTDFPHWEISVDEDCRMSATYVYAKYEGGKPNFYYKSAGEDLFGSLKTVFPRLNKEAWLSSASFSEGVDVWLDNPKKENRSARLKLASGLGSECYQDGAKVKGLEYCGPLRSRFLGYFGYFLDILNPGSGKKGAL